MLQKVKNMKQFVSPTSSLRQKVGRRRPAWQLARSSSSIAR